MTNFSRIIDSFIRGCSGSAFKYDSAQTDTSVALSTEPAPAPAPPEPVPKPEPAPPELEPELKRQKTNEWTQETNKWTQGWSNGENPYRATLNPVQPTLKPEPEPAAAPDPVQPTLKPEPAPVSSEPEPAAAPPAAASESVLNPELMKIHLCDWCHSPTCGDCLNIIDPPEAAQPNWKNLKDRMKGDYEQELEELVDDTPATKSAFRKQQDQKALKLGLQHCGEQLLTDAIERAEAKFWSQDPTRCHVCDLKEDEEDEEDEENEEDEEEEVDKSVLKETVICLVCNTSKCTCQETPNPDFDFDPDPGSDSGSDSGSDTETDTERPMTAEETVALSLERERRQKELSVTQKYSALEIQVLELQGNKPDTQEVTNSVLDALGYVALESESEKVCKNCMIAHDLKPKKAPKKTNQSSPNEAKKTRNDIYFWLEGLKFKSFTAVADHVRPDALPVKVQEQTEQDFRNHKWAMFEFKLGDTRVLFYWTNVLDDARQALTPKVNKLKEQLATLFTETPVQN